MTSILRFSWAVPALLALTLCSACDVRPAAGSGAASSVPTVAFKGVDITGADYAQQLSLPDTDGKVHRWDEFKGKAVVVFFGYTQCPDVCPTTLAEMAEVRKRLGSNGAKVQTIFVSVDPDRDTAEVLKAYVTAFGTDNLALRGTAEQTAAMARDFKVFYSKEPGKTESSYTVNHTAASYLFDPQGRVRVYSRYGSGVDALVHDLNLLLSGA